MSKSRKNKQHIKGGFSGIPRVVMDHPDYIGLSGNAVKLLNELARQYRGNNNGDLTVAYSLLKHRGFNSKDTIKLRVNELIAAGLVIKTREGRFANPNGVCALYALTWQPIDECGGRLEVSETTVPPRKFSLENNKTPRPETGQGSSQKHRTTTPTKRQRTVLIVPETGTIDGNHLDQKLVTFI